MLNKKDPLIRAVLEVMNRNHIEREAAQAVNEYFGIEDRKALPHEYQGQWDAAYQQVLNEGLSPAQQKHMDVDDDEDIDHNDLAMIRARKKRKMAEEALDEDYDPKKLRRAKKIKEKAKKLRRDRHGPVKDQAEFIAKREKEDAVTGGDTAAGPKKAMQQLYGKMKRYKGAMKRVTVDEEASLEAIQEEIAYNLAEQAEYVYENYGEEGLVEFYDSLTEEQFELLESTWDSIKNFFGMKSTIGKKTPQPGTDSDKRPKNQRPGFNAGSDPTNAAGGQRAGAAQPRGSDPTNTDSGQRAGAYQAPAPIPKARPDNLKTNTQSAPKAKAAQPAQATPKKKLSFFQKQELRRSAKNDTMDQTRRLEKRYGVKPGSTRPLEEKASGGMVQYMQDKAAARPMANMRAASGDVAPGAQQGANKLAADMNAKKAAKTAFNTALRADSKQQMRPDVKMPPKSASNNSGITGNPMGDYNPGQENSTPTSPQSQAQLNTSPTVKTRPELPAPRQKAAPIKVSDTEVMNSPEFKKARQSVGGEAGARKIAPGTRIQGLGSFNKGDTIMSRTRTQLAAKKNVGRES